MAELPTGTVTFLFTDIEGSTALWEQHRDAMRQALVRHDELVEQIVAGHHGHLVRPRGEGDSRFAVFARATDAVTAAVALQQALYDEQWLTPTPLRVRMALHTGEADLREGDYYGSAVNRCARLRSIAHGGQTLVSLATQELARDSMSPGMALLDLGAHRLKDLTRPEHVFQLVLPGLAAEFPPLKSLDARPHNLQVQRDPLLGREREVAEVSALLRRKEVGLVTLTGPGGTGKTRLSLQVAAELLEDYPDGVWFVDLAPLTDPELVSATIAQVLGVQEVGGKPVREQLAGYLRGNQLLLVLDNFEQVLAAGPLVSELLRATAGLKVLVTSREALHVQGEREYPVPPLALPEVGQREGLERLSQYAAVVLFIERARAVKPDFEVTNANAPAVAEICVRLDGLPLAIELAAARAKLLGPEALLQRLRQPLKLLTGGARDLPARQQTIRDAIAWSYDLLEPEEQKLFARLGAFVGGWTLEAAEHVCDPAGELPFDLLDGLQSLLDKSLIRRVESADDQPRFTMLETIRDYALEHLRGDESMPLICERHVRYYLERHIALAQERDHGLFEHWRAVFTHEQHNVRAALEWSIAQGDTELGLQAGRALGYGGMSPDTLNALIQQAASRARELAPQVRAHGLRAVGHDAFARRDWARAAAFLEESLALSRSVGDVEGSAGTLWWLGEVAKERGSYDEALARYAECRTMFRVLDPNDFVTCAAWGTADTMTRQGDYERAVALWDELCAWSRQAGNTYVLASAVYGLGTAAYLQGHDEQATRALQESAAVHEGLGDKGGLVWTRLYQGLIAVRSGDSMQARALFIESLTRDPSTSNEWLLARGIEGIARVLLVEGQAERAARLLATAEAFYTRSQGLRPAPEQQMWEATLALLWQQSDTTLVRQAWAEGQAMTLEQATAYALADTVVDEQST